MKQHEWWIWQSRKVDEPWALHLVARKKQRKIRADCELYADWLSPPSKLFRIVDVSIVNPTTLIRDCAKVCSAYNHPMTEDDVKQIQEEIAELKESFLDYKEGRQCTN